MGGLDFSNLTDDQLVELIRAACTEAVNRGAAPAAAAYDTYQAAKMEAERQAAEEAAEQAAAEAERLRRERFARSQERQWAVRKGIAQEAERLFGGCGFPTNDLHVVVWEGGIETRVFAQYGFDETIFTFYVTGNLKNNILPKQCTHKKDAELKANRAQIAAFCQAVAATYSKVDILLGAALRFEGEATPIGHGYLPQPLVTS